MQQGLRGCSKCPRAPPPGSSGASGPGVSQRRCLLGPSPLRGCPQGLSPKGMSPGSAVPTQPWGGLGPPPARCRLTCPLSIVGARPPDFSLFAPAPPPSPQHRAKGLSRTQGVPPGAGGSPRFPRGGVSALSRGPGCPMMSWGGPWLLLGCPVMLHQVLGGLDWSILGSAGMEPGQLQLSPQPPCTPPSPLQPSSRKPPLSTGGVLSPNPIVSAPIPGSVPQFPQPLGASAVVRVSGVRTNPPVFFLQWPHSL